VDEVKVLTHHRRSRKIKLSLYNFGSPRVGNHQFASMFNKIVPDAFRVVADGDIVTGVPTTWYKHVGTEVVIDGLNRSGTIIIDPR
jgi:predicted lipase